MRAFPETETPFFVCEQIMAVQAGAEKPAAKRKGGRRGGNRRKRISKLLSEVEQRLDLETGKVTLADFIRLTQLERELEEEEAPREIIVTWKEPAGGRSESK